jgi:phosphonate transport system ATP-binding protein
VNSGPPAVVVAHLSIRIGRTDLLRDVSLTVPAGERVVIVGANGAGKSTLLKSLTGMAKPTDGRVEVLGSPVDGRTTTDGLRRLRARVGQVFQGLHLVARLTVLENVLVGGLARTTSPLAWARRFPLHEEDRAMEALRAVGLAHAALVRTDRLSGGERQKVAVARVVHQSPDLILADEPTASLDPTAAEEIGDLLCAIAADRRATLITVIHSLRLIPRLGDRIIGMEGGRIVIDRPVALLDQARIRALYERPAVPEDRDAPSSAGAPREYHEPG